MNDAKLRGKVARILNSRELAINVGSDQGVTEGMVFNILDPTGEDIKDPDTGRILGSLRRTKLQVRVVSALPKFAVAMTFKNNTSGIGPAGQTIARRKRIGTDFAELARFLSFQQEVVTQETLRKPEGAYDPLSEKDSYVKVGDIAEFAYLANEEHS